MADETTPAADTPAIITATPVQTDIIKIEAAINVLADAGEALFADEIAALKQKRDAILEKAKVEAEAIEQSLVQKYGSSFAHAAEISMLAAILMKLFGLLK